MSDIAFDIIGRDRASAAFRNVGRSAQTANGQVSSFGTSLRSHFGKLAALTAGGLGVSALVGFGKASVDTEAKFSTSMRLIQASSKASAGQMQQMNKLAVDLGQKTVFSANEAADAMLELSKAGISTKDIMKGAADGTLLLASAGGTDLTTAATIASAAMNSFNLRGKDMGRIASALAGGANASSASVESLGQGLAQVGPGARNAGLSLQETVAALSAFDSAGIKGSDAGTSLKTMLTRLIPMTEKSSAAMAHLGLYSKKTGSAFVNANGSFKNLTQISGLLHDKLSKLSESQRAQALSLIFGSDATRAATVLMNNGATGIRKYLKATQDQNAAQKMASAAMGGTRGALEQLSGSIDTAKLRLGQALAPAVIKVSTALSGKLVPAMDGTIGLARDLGNSLNSTLVPPLKVLGGVVGDAVKFFSGLPGPIKSTAIEAGLFALVLPRLQAGATAATTAIKDQITYMRVLRLELAQSARQGQLSSSQMQALGSAAKMAAGVGGMLALSQSAEVSNKKVGALVKTAGMAAIGFSVAGPWGAAIGGAVGLLSGLKGAFGGASTAAHRNAEILRKTSAAKVAASSYDDLRSTLNKATGAYTNNTRAAIENWLQTDEVGKAARASAQSAGIGDRTLIASIMGSPEANARIARQLQGQADAAVRQIEAKRKIMSSLMASLGPDNPNGQATIDQVRAIKAQIAVLEDQKNSLAGTREALLGQGRALRTAAKDQRAFFESTAPVNRILRMTKKAYESTFSKRVRGELNLAGVPKTLASIKSVATSVGGLTRKQWQVLIKTAGIDVTARQLRGLVDTGKSAGKDTGTKYASGAMAAIANSVMPMKAAASRTVTKAAAGAKSAASAGGHGIGIALDSGLAAGIVAGRNAVIAEARATANAAIAEMRRAADSHSPSRKTMKLGRDIGAGLRIGIQQSTPLVKTAGVLLIESLVKGIDDHKVRVKVALDSLTAYISKQSSKISALTSKRSGIIDQVRGFSSSVFSAQFQDAEGNDRAGTVDDLLAFQKQQRNKARRLKHDVQNLIKAGMSKSLIQQMLAQGESGAANVHTLAGASAAQIAEFNSLNAQTSAAGTTGGEAISRALGIDAKIKEAQRNKALALEIRNQLVEWRKQEDKNTIVELHIDGKVLRMSLLQLKRKSGQKLGLD
jgi:TP901 family phage tail tape measure protein